MRQEIPPPAKVTFVREADLTEVAMKGVFSSPPLLWLRVYR